MVAVQISRQSGEVLADAGSSQTVGRVDVEVAGPATDASSGSVQITRQSAEVLAANPQSRSVSRVDVEVVGPATEAGGGATVQVSRQSAEVLGSISPRAVVTRADVEVLGPATPATAGAVQVTRQSGEALARRGSAGPVVPLALGDDNEVFLQDWADEVELTSSYETSIAISPATGAESRRSLALKPTRSQKVVWRQALDEFDENNLSRLDRLYVFLRRLTGARFAAPLYPDQRELAASYLTTDSVVAVDTTVGRWAFGGRVAIVRLNISGSYKGHSFHLISDMTDSSITLAAPLGVAVPAGSLIVPMIDCEVALEVSYRAEQGCLAEVTVTLDEVPGASQLPPTKADTPTGGQTHRGVPILDVDPDWTDGVGAGRSRQGIEFHSGRARGVSPYAGRSRQTHDLSFTNERPRYWRLVEFFDTRRGRARSFWHVDQQFIWDCVQLDPNFVSVSPFGVLADFQEELEGGQVGVVMLDGTFYVRDVVAAEFTGTVFKITVDPVLPSGLDPADVARVSRARRVRFVSDEMAERWTHAGLAETRLGVIETLSEEDAET